MGIPRIPLFRILALLAIVVGVVGVACGKEQRFGAASVPVAYPACINFEAGTDATPGPGSCGPVQGGIVPPTSIPGVQGISFVTPGYPGLPNLALWLPMDYDGGIILGDSGLVVQINDQSSNGWNCTQPNNAVALNYVTNCNDAGLPCVGADGGAAGNQVCVTDAGPVFVLPYEIIIAYYLPSASGNQTILIHLLPALLIS